MHCYPWSGWGPGCRPVGSVTGQLIPGPTRTARPAAVRDTGRMLICPLCPLKIAVHCQLESGAQFVCLGAHWLDQPRQTTCLFTQNHISCLDRSHAGKHKLFSSNSFLSQIPDWASQHALFFASLLLTSHTSQSLCHVLWNQLLWNHLEGTSKMKTMRVISAAVRHLLSSVEHKAAQQKRVDRCQLLQPVKTSLHSKSIRAVVYWSYKWRESISRLKGWRCRVVKYFSFTMSSPHLPLHHLCCLTASLWLTAQLWFLFSGWKLFRVYLFHRNGWTMKVPIATQSATDSQHRSADAESAVVILKVKRGSCSHLTVKFPSLHDFSRSTFVSFQKETRQDHRANKDTHSASRTVLMKNECVLFYSLGSLFLGEFWQITYPANLFLRFGWATEPDETRSMRVETVVFSYFGIDSELAHLECQMPSLNEQSRADVLQMSAWKRLLNVTELLCFILV